MRSAPCLVTGNAFLKSAMALEEEHRKKIGHAGPILFCYCHAIELYLKALLRLVHSVAALSTKFGHDFERLLTEAERLGLVLADEDRHVLSGIDIEAMRIGALLRKAGVPVRL